MIIGIDASIAATGYAVLSMGVLVDIGTWRTKVRPTAGKFADRARRSEEIGRAFLALLDEHKPGALFIESPVFMPRDGKMSVHASARVRGVIEGICLAQSFSLAELGTQDVKRAICGEPGASKEQVARRLFLAYGRDVRIGRADDNATDALAVAHVGASRLAPSVSSGVISHRPIERPRETEDDGMMDF